MEASRKPVSAHRRIVIKIGSALLVDRDSGLKTAWLESLCADVAELKRAGCEVLVVSSGAIAVGRRHLGLTDADLRLEEKQAAAATGMIRLAHAYQETLAQRDLTVIFVRLQAVACDQFCGDGTGVGNGHLALRAMEIGGRSVSRQAIT